MSSKEKLSGSSTNTDTIYKRYNFNIKWDTRLPIYNSKEKILSAIRSHSVVILKGYTGCGKTTQVPQYILEEGYKNNSSYRIVVSQPRCIAAMSLSKRISLERDWPQGSIVGYQVSLHSDICSDNRIIFCSAGVLLQKLIEQKSLNRYTHIIIDEIHERLAEIDFLLVIIKQFLLTNSKQCKIILMSATINTNELAEYFKVNNFPAPIIKVRNSPRYQVKEYYLDDLNFAINNDINLDIHHPVITDELYDIAVKIIISLDKIEKDEKNTNINKQLNAILIFVPGLNDLDILYEKIQLISKQIETKLWILRLHSLMSPDVQSQVFKCAPPRYRKVILSTNLAESSITVPSVKYVIDFCLKKIPKNDSATNFSTLQLVYASRSNCRQRAGRAGRVMNGRVYRLVTHRFFQNKLTEYATPEILYCPLSKLVLQAKVMDIGIPSKLLGLTMNPPNLTDIHNTILFLKEKGALFTHINGEYSVEDGDITYLGRMMLHLPLDLNYTRLIFFGYIFSVLDDAIIMAAASSVRNIFKMYSEKNDYNTDAYLSKLAWADDTNSDILAAYNIYQVWIRISQESIFNEESEKAWAKHFYVNLKTLKAMHLLILQIKKRLECIQIFQNFFYHNINWTISEKAVVLKIILAGAFYPNYFIFTYKNEPSYVYKQIKNINDTDLLHSVYFTGFDSRLNGQFYYDNIKQLFKKVYISEKNIKVHFPPDSNRVLVTVKNKDNTSFTGKISSELYKALIIRKTTMNDTIKILALNQNDLTISNQLRESNQQYFGDSELMRLGLLNETNLNGIVTYIVNCSQFYFLPFDEFERLRKINNAINKPLSLKKFDNIDSICIDMIVAAKRENEYHRAKVLSVELAAGEGTIQVSFIDIGNSKNVCLDDVRKIKNSLYSDCPPRIFECRLAMVKPSCLQSAHGLWCDNAIAEMCKLFLDKKTNLEIYSIVGEIANVFIVLPETTFNNILLYRNWATRTEESYFSKVDHDLRCNGEKQSQHLISPDNIKANNRYRSRKGERRSITPLKGKCTHSVNLRGPFSMLETKMFSVMRSGLYKSVDIERDSINFILQDNSPQDSYQRLLVAGITTSNNKTNCLTAHSTTIMPNIHGFAALMAMIFCHKMQLKRNTEKTQYTSLLAGLGFHKDTMKSIYKEHDILLDIDVDISQSDIDLVNELRLSMDLMIYSNSGEQNLKGEDRENIPYRIKSLLIRLLERQRRYIGIQSEYSDTTWTLQDSDNLNVPEKRFNNFRCSFPQHSTNVLYEETDIQLEVLSKHCKNIHTLAQTRNKMIPPIKCLLCNLQLSGNFELRMHLLSQLHRDQEDAIKFKFN